MMTIRSIDLLDAGLSCDDTKIFQLCMTEMVPEMLFDLDSGYGHTGDLSIQRLIDIVLQSSVLYQGSRQAISAVCKKSRVSTRQLRDRLEKAIRIQYGC
jgi:hypothetical protein